VQPMEAGQREERRREEVAVDRDAVRVQARVLSALSDDEDQSEHHRGEPPETEPAAIIALEPALRQVDRRARGEEGEAEERGAADVEIAWSRTARAARPVVDVGGDQAAEEEDLRRDEHEDPERRRRDRAQPADTVPDWTQYGRRREVVRRGRRRGRPFERLAAPRVVAGGDAV